MPKGADFGERCDAIIIGSGAGGAPLAAELCRAGLRVVMLEAGSQHSPLNFATDERATEYLFWNDERLSAGEHPIAFGANNSGQGVGGSTLHWTAYTPSPIADDFRMRSTQGVGLDWPFGLDELQPYLKRVVEILGVSGPGETYPNRPLPLNAAAQLMARGCDALGIPYEAAANAAPSRPYFHEEVGWRSMCTGRGFCQAGCSVGAKGSADVTWIPMALRHGLDLRPNARVTEISTEGGRATG
ncbi:GMC family oxidoreductase, partial [bacterium]